VIRNIKDEALKDVRGNSVRGRNVTGFFSNLGLFRDINPLAPAAEDAEREAFTVLDEDTFKRFVKSAAFKAIKGVSTEMKYNSGFQISAAEYMNLWKIDEGKYLSYALHPFKDEVQIIADRMAVRDLLGSNWRMDTDVTYTELAIIKAAAHIPECVSWDEVRCEELAFSAARRRVFELQGIEYAWGMTRKIDVGAWREFCAPDEALSWTLETFDKVDKPDRFEALRLASEHSFDTCKPYFDAGIWDYSLVRKLIGDGVDSSLASSMGIRGSASQ